MMTEQPSLLPSRLLPQGVVQKATSRITCMVHHRLDSLVQECLAELGGCSALVEPGRSVRQLRRPRRFGLPGKTMCLENQPVEVYRITVERDRTRTVMETLIANVRLDQPGRGTLYSQDLMEFRRADGKSESFCDETQERSQSVPHEEAETEPSPIAGQPSGLLHDLSMITCILSMAGSGAHLASVALELGTCVPVVTLGVGTGLRDRLGLLRITVPQEKEIVHLLVPSHDAEGIVRILIEEGNLNQPGRGFVYQAPVSLGLIDTRLRIGPQEHAASIEQIIAAIDGLKNGTAWRKRFVSMEGDETDDKLRLLSDNREITILCTEGRAESLVATALDAGAGGATTSRVRRLAASQIDEGSAARERSTISVPASICPTVVAALLEQVPDADDGQADCVQVLESPAQAMKTYAGRVRS